MGQYRKKPVVVEALRWEGSMDSQREIVNWSSGVVVGMFGGAFDEPQRYFLEIYTLEGTMRAEIGDWVIRGVQGEYYPCRDDIFRMTYEEIDDAPR